MLYQNFIAMAVALSAVLFVPADAHPGEVEPVLTARQLERRQTAINARHAVARKCDGAIAAFEAQRRARRSALVTKKHHGPTFKNCTESATKTSTANVPTYTTLQNVRYFLDHFLLPYSLIFCQTTCILTPEIDPGPYYIVRISTEPSHIIISLSKYTRSTKNYFVRIFGMGWTASLCYSMLVSWT
jgi:hypothetical protein